MATHDACAESDATVRSLYGALIEGWNAGSGEAFASPFTDDADLIGYDGTQLKGRAAIALFHQQLFSWILQDSRMVGKVRLVRQIGPEVAILHAVGGLIVPGAEGLEPTRNIIQCLVAVIDNGTWRIASLQSTRVAYIGRPEAAEKLASELRELM